MAILTFPNILPASADWRLQPNTAVFTSPFNGAVQTYERPGARWVVSLNFPNLTPTEGRLMSAFMTSLRGAAGRFYLHDHTLPTPQGTASGSLTVAASAGNVLTVGGLPVSTSGVFVVGDMVGISGQLYMITSTTGVSDASGNVNITVEAPPRAAIVNGTAVTTNKPTTVFRLKDDNQAAWRVQPLLYNMALVCEEVF